MKLALTIVLITLFCVFLAIMTRAVVINAQETDEPIGLIEMEATAYCYGSSRCDGGPVREGICAAAPKYYSKVAIVFERNDDGSPGDFIGYFEVLDTGGDYRIQNGDVIDIYHPSKEWCKQFGRQKVWVRFVDGKG